MKLRNKKTGEIVEPFGITCVNGRTFVQFDDGKGTFKFEAHSLAELNAEWEDYEEPKEYYWIDYDGKVKSFIDLYEWHDKMKELGNYFETKEEAEKAVEKLKAWKRLKDKGFRFRDFVRLNDCATVIRATFDESWSEIYDDLDLLFGGEE